MGCVLFKLSHLFNTTTRRLSWTDPPLKDTPMTALVGKNLIYTPNFEKMQYQLSNNGGVVHAKFI